MSMWYMLPRNWDISTTIGMGYATIYQEETRLPVSWIGSFAPLPQKELARLSGTLHSM